MHPRHRIYLGVRKEHGKYSAPFSHTAGDLRMVHEFLQTRVTDADVRELALGNASRAQLPRRSSR